MKKEIEAISEQTGIPIRLIEQAISEARSRYERSNCPFNREAYDRYSQQNISPINEQKIHTAGSWGMPKMFPFIW